MAMTAMVSVALKSEQTDGKWVGPLLSISYSSGREVLLQEQSYSAILLCLVQLVLHWRYVVLLMENFVPFRRYSAYDMSRKL